AGAVRPLPRRVAGRGGRRVPPGPRRLDPPPARARVRGGGPPRASCARKRGDAPLLRLRQRRVGAQMAVRGHLGGAREVSVPPAPPILLASTSPQRRAILEQLGIPFDVVPPRYEEDDATVRDPVEMVREHAQGKARSVAGEAGDRPVLGVDTAVVLAGRVFAKPANATEAEAMLETLGGERHAVISGLCLVTPGWEFIDADTTFVTFRK